MVTFVTDYITRVRVQSQQVLLHHKPLPSSFPPDRERPWDSISMDFIEGLPLSDGMTQSWW